MLSSEDLIDLGEELRASGFKLATYQYFAAQSVLLHFAVGEISDRRRLATLLGPIFCTTATEQSRFGELFEHWLTRRFPEMRSDVEPPEPESAALAELGYSRLHWKIIAEWKIFVAIAALLLAAAVGWAFWQMYQPREIRGIVREKETSQLIPQATIEFGDQKVSSDESGGFLIRTTTSALPGELKISKEGFESTKSVVGQEYERLRRRLYLWPRLPGLNFLNIELIKPPPPRPSVQIEYPPLTSSEPVRIGAPRIIDLNAVVPPVRWWQRLIWRDVAWMSLPLVLFALWQLWSWIRRPALQRFSSRTPATVREVHLPGGVSAPTAALPLRRLSQELRRRRFIHSDELQVSATIEASLRNLGMFSPVRGSRVEPEYIALMDTASQADHQARLGNELLRHLLRSDVLIESYVFQGSPGICVHSTSLSFDTIRTSSVARRVSESSVLRLEELHQRSPEHRVLVFSDGTSLFDPFTGALTAAAETLLLWPMPTVLTSRPLEQWGEIEWALERRGFTVLPISRAGITALMISSSGAPSERFLNYPEQRHSLWHERNPRRLLERDSPSEADIERLCTELRNDLCEQGFTWLAACAAYPEIHWGITLRLGAALVPRISDQERLLPRLARLPWFREAYMPDWLRKALLERLTPIDEAMTRALLHKLLVSLSGETAQEIPLRIALGSPAPRGWIKRVANSVRNVFERWHLWRKSAEVIHAASPESPLRDHVFLRFISGTSVGKLSLSAPGTLLRLLFRGGSPLLGFHPAVALLMVLISSAAIGVVVEPIHSGAVRLYSGAPAVTIDGSVVSMFVQTIESSKTDFYGEFLTLGIIKSDLEGRFNSWWRQAIYPEAEKMRFSPSGRYVAILISGLIIVHETSPNNRINFIKETGCENLWRCFAFSGNETRFVYSPDPEKGALNIIDLPRIDKGFPFTLSQQLTGSLGSIALNEDGSQLAVSASDGTATWRLDTGEVISRWDSISNRLIYRGDQLLSIGFAGQDGVWDVAANRRIASLESTSSIEHYAISEAKPLLATLTNDEPSGSLSLIDLANGALLNDLFPKTRDDYNGVSLSRDGKWLAATSEAGMLSVWSIPKSFPSPPPPGRSFALVVASNYEGSRIQLDNAERDGQAVASVLRNRFGFGVTLLEGRTLTYAHLLEALRQLRETLEPQDRLLIFLSGHGSGGPISSEQFQFMTRVLESNNFESMPGDRLVGELKQISARSVLVIGDASDARKLVKTLPDSPPSTSSHSRELIASYDVGDPLDGPSGGNSPFVAALLQTLETENGAISARILTDKIAARMRAIQGSKQRPTYARLEAAGDDGTSSFEFPVPLSPPKSMPEPVEPQRTESPAVVDEKRNAITIEFDKDTYVASEGDGAVKLTVQRTGSLRREVAFTWRLRENSANLGTDFIDTGPGVERIPAGVRAVSFTVPLVQDSVVESTELFLVELQASEDDVTLGERSSAAVIIVDDD